MAKEKVDYLVIENRQLKYKVDGVTGRLTVRVNRGVRSYVIISNGDQVIEAKEENIFDHLKVRAKDFNLDRAQPIDPEDKLVHLI